MSSRLPVDADRGAPGGRLGPAFVLALLVLAVSTGAHELPAEPVVAAAVARLQAQNAGEAAPRSPEVGDAGLRFRDVAAEAGVDFRYTFGDFSYDNILESSGSGVTWFDADGDGDLDLYLLNGAYLPGVSDPKGRAVIGATNHLYCNDGGGRFHDCTARSGLGDPTWSMAAAAADFDDDGDTDLFVADYGPNRLYRNRGDGTFEDVAADLGLAGLATLNGFTKWSVGASWFDADGDGRLDLFVCDFLAFDPGLLVAGREWEMPEPSAYDGQPSLLYLQEDRGGARRFRDGTRQAGLYRPHSKCMGLTVFDMDGDGRLDVFQGNDHQENFLFRARGDGTFEEVGRQAGVAVNDAGLATGSMHGSPGDVDGDGRLDLLVTDLRHGSLYRRAGAPLLFEDVTRSSGVGRLLDGLGQWGAGLHDLDLDGDLDLFATTGVANVLVPQHPVLAVNDGRGRFRDARAGAGAYFQGPSGRGAAFADFDDDGDLDIAVNHVDHQARMALLRNDTPRRGHWVGFRLVGGLVGAHPRDAFGARVEIDTGDSTLVRIDQPQTSYLSGNDPRVHFGLGSLDRVPKLTVHWPSGRVQSWTGLAADRYWTLEEGSATAR